MATLKTQLTITLGFLWLQFSYCMLEIAFGIRTGKRDDRAYSLGYGGVGCANLALINLKPVSKALRHPLSVPDDDQTGSDDVPAATQDSEQDAADSRRT